MKSTHSYICHNVLLLTFSMQDLYKWKLIVRACRRTRRKINFRWWRRWDQLHMISGSPWNSLISVITANFFTSHSSWWHANSSQTVLACRKSARVKLISPMTWVIITLMKVFRKEEYPNDLWPNIETVWLAMLVSTNSLYVVESFVYPAWRIITVKIGCARTTVSAHSVRAFAAVLDACGTKKWTS